MEATDTERIQAVLAGDTSAFEPLVRKYQPRVFAIARRYARRESEVEDIVQEVFVKAFTKLGTFRAESPFEHWLMRLAVRTCFDFLRAHQRNREQVLSEITEDEVQWLERVDSGEAKTGEDDSNAARTLVHKLLETLSPQARLVIQLLEIEEKSIKEIAQLTGWSIPMIKVRAFRARALMKKNLQKLNRDRYV